MLVNRIDINCDMGEGMPADDFIIPYITSANIACGFHAGGETVMRKTIELAERYKVKIGAHPSFHDRANFGRTEMNLPHDEIYALVLQQLVKIDLLVKDKGIELHHVKPHGALYNMAAKNYEIATCIVQAMKDYNEKLVLYGLSGSELIKAGNAHAIQTASEVFADRSYEDDGSLTPRKKEGALIEDEEEVVNRVIQMITDGKVRSYSGKELPIVAETVCIHSDGRNALKLAKALYNTLHINSQTIIN